jgi:hypothetical protein
MNNAIDSLSSSAHQSQADRASIAATRTLEAGAVLIYLPTDHAASEAVHALGKKITVTIAGPLRLARRLEGF